MLVCTVLCQGTMVRRQSTSRGSPYSGNASPGVPVCGWTSDAELMIASSAPAEPWPPTTTGGYPRLIDGTCLV
jgi:hypothetical protein